MLSYYRCTYYGEELIFRRLLFNKWAETQGIFKAMLFSSLLFSALHINEGFIGHFITGFFFCMVYVRTKKLIVPIVLHGIHNAFSGLFLLPAIFYPSADTLDTEGIEQIIPDIHFLFMISSAIFLFRS
ncbi:CPBP family intramembrane glutamic endopeptidase [Bacillus gobiensis]|uniref:CPBP family intramembrane glutamic endopeptidase n=1 Tax=Bacillus gobiensis TaxID=1441095 RepID=UPI003D241D7A